MGAGSRDNLERETLVSFSENCHFNRACTIATKFRKDHKLAPHIYVCMRVPIDLVCTYMMTFNEFRDL